jgi:hypothetical protein
MKKTAPRGSDTQGLLADLLEGPRRRNLSANSLAAYERTWRTFLAWAAAASFDPRSLSFPTALEAYRFLGEGKNAASLKQIRAALSFAYKHWDLKNPFTKIDPPLHNEPPNSSRQAAPDQDIPVAWRLFCTAGTSTASR